MPNLIYHGEATAVSGSKLPDMSASAPPTIIGTIVGNGSTANTLTFTLLQNVNDEAPKATMKATFWSSEWPKLSETITITPTFIINSTNVLGGQMFISTSTGLGSDASPPRAESSTFPSTSSGPSTSSSTSSTSSRSSTSPSKSNGYASGTLAGAAVGCLIAGLLIASLLAFLIFRRRTRSKTPRYSLKSDARTSEIDGESFVLATGSKNTWQKHLPQPESDQTISRLSNRTLDDIELFVENFYVDQPMKHTDGAVASDMLLFSSPYLGLPLVDIIQTSHSPTALLKHCIAYYLLLKIDPTHNDSTSLLPREFVVPAKGMSQHKQAND